MARHILAGRGHPVFYYGSPYNGSVEPHLVAAVFSFLGASFTSYRVTMSLLLGAILVGVVLLARLAFGRVAALISLTYLAFPPFFFLYKGLTSDGAYDTLLLIAIGLLFTALIADKNPRKERSFLPSFGLGFLAGVGLWITPLTVSISVPVLAWTFFSRRQWLSWKEMACTVFGGILGAFPWWFWNMRHDWASVRAAELKTASALGFAKNLASIFWISIPTLEGGVIATPDVRQPTETFTLSRILALLALVVVMAPTAARILRGDRRRLLFAFGLASILGAGACSGRLAPTEPRFLFVYYVVMAPLVGASLADPAGKGWTHTARFLAVVLLLVLHTSSILAARNNLTINDREVTASLEPLIRALEKWNIRYVYSNYWTAYRLSFESNEKIIATPLTGDEFVRYQPYRTEVDRAPDPAVALLDERDVCFEAFLREEKIRHLRNRIDSFGVYSELGMDALLPLRLGRGLPLPSFAHRVGWKLGPQPGSMNVGRSKEIWVEVLNQSPCVWPTSVHLSYHWWPLDVGNPAIYDGQRGFIPDLLRPGERATIAIDVIPPSSPGRYRLEYDLVHEAFAWFSTRGGQTSSVEMKIVAAEH